AEPSYLPQGFALWWERAQDLSFVIGALLDHPKYRARIDPGRIGALGFSLGGWTVLTLAGARVDLERWEKACAEAPERAGCALPPEATFEISELERLARDNPIYRASRARAGQSFSDPRVRAVVALAPSIGFSFDPASLREVPIPVALKVGAKDDQAPPEETTQIEAHVPDASLDILPEVGHYTFLAPCTLRGRWLAPDLCREPGGANRRALHAEVSVAARTFFDAKLERSPGK
ncbi:MAG: alpha/beta fold hydrolase, partial [Myxococcota bacterium]